MVAGHVATNVERSGPTCVDRDQLMRRGFFAAHRPCSGQRGGGALARALICIKFPLLRSGQCFRTLYAFSYDGRPMDHNVLQIRIRHGLDVAMPGVPEQLVCDGPRIGSVALQGHDYPGVRPRLAVQVGDQVARGAVLFSDRRRPTIKFTAPVCGRVAAIDLGHRRSFASLLIDVAGDGAGGDVIRFDRPAGGCGAGEVRALLLASGLWPALRVRPFGDIPDADAVPHAIFVTAMDSNPLAADAAVVLEGYAEQFREGVRWLSLLTHGKVYVCQRPGAPLAGTGLARVVTALFDGPHPAGLAGTHIHHLSPASRERHVWHIGYQDVLAIGHLARTGHIPAQRVVALGGPGVRAPRLLRTLPGANLNDLVAGQLDVQEQPARQFRLVSGSPLCGRESSYLNRFHDQVSVLPATRRRTSPSWWARLGQSNDQRRGAAPIIPHEALENVLPFDIYAVPLMRALSAGDADAAQRLGCLELVEEDVALLSLLCTSKTDYGRLLRDALTALRSAA